MPTNPSFVDEELEPPMAPADEYQQGDQFDKGSDDFSAEQTEVMPEGNYCCRFEKGEMKGSQSSNDWQFVFDFVVTEGEWRNKNLKAFTTLIKEGQAKNMSWKLDEIMSALKAPSVEVNGKRQWKGSFSKLVGRAVIIEVKHYQGRESIGKVSPPDARAEEAAKNFV